MANAKVTGAAPTGRVELDPSTGKMPCAAAWAVWHIPCSTRGMVTRSLSRHLQRQTPRRFERGITRFELGFAVGALTLTLSGALFALNKTRSDGRVESSERAAGQILDAASDYVGEVGAGCPTVSSLKRDKFLEVTARTSDAWGARFRILCHEDKLIVHSAGADAKNSGDDVRVTRSRT